MENNKLPRISFVLCTYFGERTLDECLKSLASQDYPKEKMEILIADGGSKDKTLEIARKYKNRFPKLISINHNPAQYDDGRGAGKDTFSRKSKGEIICFIDQDNILIDKEWIRKMIAPFENKDIQAVQSRMAVVEKDSMINKYLSAIGIEDPFAIPYSLNAQLVLNPWKFEYVKKGDYYIFHLAKNRYLYAGNNGFMARRKDFFKAGGYNQDNDNFARMAALNYNVAVPRNARLHHSASTDFRHMIEKRTKYVIRYVETNYNNRDFYWFDLKKNSFQQNLKFVSTVLFNMLFIPGLVQGSYMSLKTRGSYWMLHPVMLFSITSAYIAGSFYSFVNRKIIRKGFERVNMTKQNN